MAGLIKLEDFTCYSIGIPTFSENKHALNNQDSMEFIFNKDNTKEIITVYDNSVQTGIRL
jgi:hypothetical protein